MPTFTSMYKILAIALLVVSTQSDVDAQLPKEGSSLTCRMIGFAFPAKKSSTYKIELANGNYTSEDFFKKHVFKSLVAKTNEIIAEVPDFGAQYTWRVAYTAGNKSEYGPLHHFSIRKNSQIDSNLFRLRVMRPAAEKVKNYFVVGDGGGVLYNMNGKPVWFIPDTNGFGGYVGDLKFTEDSTITFICKDNYEITLGGDVIWKSPKAGLVGGDSTHPELYHHEFTKLPDGNYMAMAMQIVFCKKINKDGKNTIITMPASNTEPPKDGFREGRFGCLIEYDRYGKILWTWKSMDYLLNADFPNFTPAEPRDEFDAHDNAFFFDFKNKVIYIGFRNINRIVKIRYPDGKILNTYGRIYNPGQKSIGAGLFCGQHNIDKNKDGYLYYFNNNSCVDDMTPSVVMLKEPSSESDSLSKVWEYKCVAEGVYQGHYLNGGNARELPGNLMFINMGSKYAKWEIIDLDKNIFWQALPERYIESDSKWVPLYEYRANIIDRASLEKLIWKAEKNSAL